MKVKIRNLIMFLVLSMFALLAIEPSEAKALTYKDREAMALRIKKGAGIHVEEYQKDSNTYVIRIEGEPAVGPNITTPEWLLEGIDNGMSIETVKRNPRRLVGSYFRLKRSLWLLSDQEIAARKASDKGEKR